MSFAVHPHRVPVLPRLAAFAGLVLAFALSALAVPAAGQPALQEGKQYTRLKNAVPVETGNKVEVIEFFSYGCPHCADLEPVIEDWLKTLPPDVQFRRVPVLFQPRWVSLAKVYYTLEALGAASKLTPEVFSAVHKQGIDLSNEKTFFDWAATKGLDRKKVEDMYGSFGINGKVNRAKSLGGTYNVQSVPTVIVDGKFMTASDRVGTHAQLPAAINALVDKARAERKH
ncbi:MAG: thiol:disulfide interchange protein DsbA/DsbL [Pseudomonadota bacterium]|nr:thiol:disulfide interchange protein DsbA/DsbL [Pseudomonadota bacterium]